MLIVIENTIPTQANFVRASPRYQDLAFVIDRMRFNKDDS
jgi:hypothetical protein